MRIATSPYHTALVTGASRGIGFAVATALADRGMHVFMTARDPDRLSHSAARIRDRGGHVDSFPADLSRESGVIALFARIRETVDALDVCINNAGIGLFDPVSEIKSSDLDRMYETNIRGTFLCCRESMRMMIPSGSGYIINISSVVGFKGYPDQAGYGATKHAVMGLTKALAAEAHPHGIRVSAILPGGVETEMVAASRPDLKADELLHPDDVAQAVLYLLSLSDRAAIDEIYLRRRMSKPF